VIIWELSPSGRYDLLDAYQDRAHLQFIGADDDGKLLAFVRKWGPVVLWLRTVHGQQPVEEVIQFRQELEAWTRLFAALDKPAYPRDFNLRKYVIELFRLIPDVLATPIRDKLRMPSTASSEEIETRLVSASKAEFENVCEIVVGSFPGALLANSLVIERSRTGTQLRASAKFVGLRDALNWMVYQDIYLRKPFAFCLECRRLIMPTSGHVRRFCRADDRPCARRWTDRNSKKEKRAEARKRRLADAARAGNVKRGKA
jgi:hypothetical protein